jgi:hypothetical protein
VPLGDFIATGFPEILCGKGMHSYCIALVVGCGVVLDTTSVSECRWNVAGRAFIGVKSITNRTCKEN